jgi:hypothetical protein
MQAKSEYRDRPDVEVAVLDALVDRASGGMTVFELRSHVDASIDDIEDALGSLKADGLIAADEQDGRTVITVDDRVVPDTSEPDQETDWLDAIRRKLGF